LFTLTNMDGTPAVTSSIGLAVAIMFIFKFVGANMFRLYLNITEGKEDKSAQQPELNKETA
ncbi:YjiH family protein, partial [Photobacterium sp. OFAV2-7]|nr:YjiH family protein [Photobacterium sp. OFAV2-7]